MPRSGASSTGSAFSPTVCTSPAGVIAGSARSIPGDERSLSSAGREFPSTTMSEQLTLGPSDHFSSPEDSPAREPQPQGCATASITPRPFCGARWPEPLASFDPATFSWRTWRTSLLSETEPSGERFSGTWPRSGTTRSGIAYPQQPSAPRTSVTGSSPLLPTPTQAQRTSMTYGRGNPTLIGALLPTPMARVNGGTEVSGSGRTGGPMLAESLLALLPTPSATPYGNNQSPSEGVRVRPALDGVLRLLETPTATLHDQLGANGGENRKELVARLQSSGASTSPPSDDGSEPLVGALENPSFREWLLGAPDGWSDPACPLSATAFKCNWESSQANTSSNSSGSV